MKAVFKPEGQECRNPTELQKSPETEPHAQILSPLPFLFIYFFIVSERARERKISLQLDPRRLPSERDQKKRRAEIWPARDGVKRQRGKKTKWRGSCERRYELARWTSFPSCSHLRVRQSFTLYLSNSFCSPLSLHQGVFFVPGHYYHYFIFYRQCATTCRVSLNIAELCELLKGASH